MSTKKIVAEKVFSFILACLALTYCIRPTLAQEICGFEFLNQHRPETPQLFTRSNEIYTIPVVVHIIHHSDDITIGTGSNLSDAHVISVIDNLTDRHQFNPSGDTGLRFCLAETDPDGAQTTGINRYTWTDLYDSLGVNAQFNSGESDLDLKISFHWPWNDYFNVYIVHSIDGVSFGGGVGGYAYFPTNSPYDGVVMRADRFDASITTFAHEVGHFFGLYHTFQGNPACGSVEADCAAEGDRVCDTEPHPVSWACPQAACLIAPWTNYLSYSSCRTDYSLGQIDRMHNEILLSSVRISLTQSDVCTYTGDPPDTYEPCNDPCPNDVCENAAQYQLCDVIPFCNTNCNTEDPFPVLQHPAQSSVACGGFNHYRSSYYYVDIATPGYYIMTIDTTPDQYFVSTWALGPINYGDPVGVMWSAGYSATASCDDILWITTGTCLTSAPECFCGPTGPSAWAGLCQDAPCGSPLELQPYWWLLSPPDFPLDLDPPPNIYPYNGEYDPTRQEWQVLMPLAAGRHYFMLSSFNAAGHESIGGANFSLCPLEAPLSIQPILEHTGLTLHWRGQTATDWAVFEFDDVQWNEIARTINNEYLIIDPRPDRTTLYRVAGSTGFSNIISINVVKGVRGYELFDVTGREGVRFGVPANR